MPIKPIEGSSALAGYHYDPKAKTFEVKFTSGGVYRYTDVPRAAVRSILRAKSKGKMFHKKIKNGGYAYEKLAAQISHSLKDVMAQDPDAEPAEAAYWLFDSLKKRKGTPMEERDAFKAVFRQKIANDPIKVKFDVQGVPVHIEWKKGETRLYKDHKTGEVKYKRLMKAHYGYIPNTKDADGEELDVYLGDDHTSSKAFVIKQLMKKTGEFDENKVMIGYPTEAAAKASYMHHMSACPECFGGIHEVPVKSLIALFGENGDGKEKVMKKAAAAGEVLRQLSPEGARVVPAMAKVEKLEREIRHLAPPAERKTVHRTGLALSKQASPMLNAFAQEVLSIAR